MNSIKVIEPIIDAAERLKKAEIVSEDQKFEILKQCLFKGRDTTKIPLDTVFSEILQEIQKVPSLFNQFTKDEILRSNVINKLQVLVNFLKSYLISHEPLDKSVSDKLVKSLVTTIIEIEKLPRILVETSTPINAVSDNSTVEKAMSDLRTISETMQSVTTYEEIKKAVENAIDAMKIIDASPKEKRNQADVFIQAIQEKVHLFIIKEINHFKKSKNEPAHILAFKERLKIYRVIANDWSGSHKEYLLEQIEDLYNKI
jgi:hypothetical protein